MFKQTYFLFKTQIFSNSDIYNFLYNKINKSDSCYVYKYKMHDDLLKFAGPTCCKFTEFKSNLLWKMPVKEK